MSSDTALSTAIALLRSARYAVALTGAGISTHSGIPDFRSPHSGLWQQHNPAEVASLYGFRHNPKRFYEWIRPLAHTILAAEPNAAHLALAQMEAHGYLRSVITQNIDLLHTRAGSQTVHEIHGHLRTVTCIHCFREFPAQPHIHAYLQTGKTPVCPDCGHALKPNVILFGEQLPTHALTAARREAQRCDVMLVAGSSLEVYPAADLPVIARRHGAALIFVNLAATALDSLATIVIHGDVVDVLPRLAEALEGSSA